MIKKSMFFLLLFASSILNAQDYFVTWNKDTVFCSKISFNTRNGYMSRFSYKDTAGNYIEKEGKKKLMYIRTMSIEDTIYDWMPFNPKKPVGSHLYAKRVVNGKINVNTYDTRYPVDIVLYNTPDNRVRYDLANALEHPGDSRWGYDCRQFILPDGKIYNLSRQNAIKVLKPYLFKCVAFKEKYSGILNQKRITVFEYKIDAMLEIIDAIRLYNSLCE